jgi:hypothetical protein
MTLLIPLLFALAPLPNTEPPPSAALERGLETISPDEIRSDLYFIASDEMNGRDTISPEQRIAARFIRARLQRLGFQPGNGDKFLYEFPLAKKALDPASLTADITRDGTSTTLTYGVDYVFTDSFGTVAMDSVADTVFCGLGERKDFDEAVVAGNWAVVSYTDENVYRIRSRARKAGAVGLLLAPEEGADLIRLFDERDDASFDGRIGWPSSDKGSGRKPFPILALGAHAGELVLGPDEHTAGEPLGASFHESRDLVGGGQVMAEDVVAFWPGSDPTLKDEVLIVSAHYDHVGVRNGQIYNGADDNGSGTCGLLALAEALQTYGPMRRSVMLIWVSGEEKGLWGSKAWASNPSLPEGTHAVADINMDMIGRNAPNVLYVTPSSKHKGYNGLTRLAERFGEEEGFGDFPEGREQGFDGLGSADIYYQRSDHAEFAKLDIPVCFLFCGEHEDYHQPGDTPDKIDYGKISRVTRTVLKMLDGLQDDNLSL